MFQPQWRAGRVQHQALLQGFERPLRRRCGVQDLPRSPGCRAVPALAGGAARLRLARTRLFLRRAHAAPLRCDGPRRRAPNPGDSNRESASCRRPNSPARSPAIFITAAACTTNDASIDPTRLLLALWRRAVDSGAAVVDRCAVEAIDAVADGFEVLTGARNGSRPAGAAGHERVFRFAVAPGIDGASFPSAATRSPPSPWAPSACAP